MGSLFMKIKLNIIIENLYKEYKKMKVNTIENILDSMLESLTEFKSEDIKYYRKQAQRIIKHINNQNRLLKTRLKIIETLLIDKKSNKH